MTKKALFPGTFNPPTLGHQDIINRACEICDYLYVGVALNSEKKEELFNFNERKMMLQEIIKGKKKVEIVNFSGLVTDFVKENKIDFIIRGLRAFSDFEYEFQMALANRKLTGVETVFLMAGQQHFHISSTLIKEIGRRGHRLHQFVPEEIEDIIFQRLAKT